MLNAYLLDDEALALQRLARLLAQDGRLNLCGQHTDPVQAVAEMNNTAPDVLFLDIQMPEWDGFRVLKELTCNPLVVFVTAYDQYALHAFETNSVAYLLKPIREEKLQAAIDKVERLGGGESRAFQLRGVLEALTLKLAAPEASAYPRRISSRIGEKLEFIELSRITHFYSEDKVVFAATAERNYIVDWTIADLEEKLDPAQFARVHRGALVNLSFVSEMYSLLAGKYVIRLRDGKRTELLVAKERAKSLREKLSL